MNSAKVRVILDSGSQRSYITNRVRNQLNLPTEKTETMVIKTFGSEEERIQTCDSVKFVLKSQHDQAEISLSAYAVPMICEPLQHQFTSQAQQSYDHLRDLNLADCSTGIDNSEVDVLIGCDQYWDLVTGEVRRGENGPTAVCTRLGWVLSGPVEDERMPISKPATNLATTHVLRCATSPTQTQSQGRLEKVNLQLMTKHPIILDKNHYLTTLIIRECHKKVMHNGVKEMRKKMKLKRKLKRMKRKWRNRMKQKRKKRKRKKDKKKESKKEKKKEEKVKVFSKKGRSTTIKRPVQRLYPLEIRSTARESELPVEAKDDDKPEVTRTRPRRAAAIEADNRRKRWIKDLDL